MRLSLVLSVLRPAGPVAIGVSLGFTLSLLSVTWVEEPCGPPPRPATRPRPDDGPAPPPGLGNTNGNAARRPNAVPAGMGADSWEPRVVPYRPPSPGRAAKKAVRCGGTGRAGGVWAPAGANRALDGSSCSRPWGCPGVGVCLPGRCWGLPALPAGLVLRGLYR